MDKIAQFIIKKTCSKDFQKAIKKYQTVFNDFDLITLAKNACSHLERLEMMKMLKMISSNQLVKNYLDYYLQKEEENVKCLMSKEENCIYEVKIKVNPNSYEESYLAQTFNGAIQKVKGFEKKYQICLTDQSRIEITKRIVQDTTENEFAEDYQSSAVYDGYMLLLDVWSINSKKYPSENEDLFDEIMGHIINVPHFLSDGELISYHNYHQELKYALIYLYDNYYSGNDGYCIEIDADKILNFFPETPDNFFEELVFPLHQHVYFPHINRPKKTEVPKNILRAYQKLRKLLKKYDPEKN